MAALAALFGGLWLLTPTVLAPYDVRTKEQLLQTVNRELPPHATLAQMDAFMRRHTDMYDFSKGAPYGLADDQFGGRLRQTKVDKFFMGRMVLLHLKVDPRTETYKSADVEIAYTFL